MIKVALCGHMRFREGDVSSLLKACAQDRGIGDLYIREFANPTDLIDACMSVPPDTEPLDVAIVAADLQGLSGVELARELRDAGIVPHDLRLVFCAPTSQHAYDAYAAGACGFLVEPVVPADFARILGPVMDEVACIHEASVVVHCRKRVRRIAFSRIRYVETVGHDQVIHLEGQREPAVARGSSKAMFSQLEGDGRFFKVGSSYIVNLDHVRQLATHVGTVTFDDGFQVPVPVRCRKALGDAMAAHAAVVL